MYDELVKRLRMRANLFKQINQMENCIMDEAADAIEKLSKPKWIPVTKQMPPEGKYVLVYGKELHPNPQASQIEVSKVYDLNYWSGIGRTGKITHWMPLPEPPKEET